MEFLEESLVLQKVDRTFGKPGMKCKAKRWSRSNVAIILSFGTIGDWKYCNKRWEIDI